jgi:hypothetical protein
MPERLIRESWAIFCEDGPNANDIAGDGEITLDSFTSRKNAEDEILPVESDDVVDWLGFLQDVNQCTAFRVGKVKLVEVEDA